MKYLAFDLEIAKEIPEDAPDWKAHRPFGISCAATLASDEFFTDPKLFFSMTNGEYEPAMKQNELFALWSYLRSKARTGYTILTWNGLSFDFDVLAEESGLHQECATLAMNHVDMMFHIFCLRGHYLGLDKAAKGLNLTGKTENVSGAKAPQMWANGQQREVLNYVGQDVRTTLQIAHEVERLGMVQWTSVKGRTNTIDIERWLTVSEAQKLPVPDTSWMTNPVSRAQFTEWMET